MQNTILNLTQHQATQDQLDAGVFEPTPAQKARIKEILTFDSSVLKYPEIIEERAAEMAALVTQFYSSVHVKLMIGGAPFFMGPLGNKLTNIGYKVVYSFTDRVSVDQVNEDGTITKTSVFKHLGFVPHIYVR